MSCEIVRDLLPLYVDGLTSEASRAAVEAHLANCGDCRDCLEDLRRPLPVEPAPEEEIDYLKKLRKKLRFRRGALAVLALAVLGALLKVYVIGSPADFSAVTFEEYALAEEAGELRLTGEASWRGSAVRSAGVSRGQEPGEVFLKIRLVRKSPLFSRRDFSVSVPAEERAVVMMKDRGRPVTVASTHLFDSFIGGFSAGEYTGGAFLSDLAAIRELRELADGAAASGLPLKGEPDLSEEGVCVSFQEHRLSHEDLWEGSSGERRVFVYRREGLCYLEDWTYTYDRSGAGAPDRWTPNGKNLRILAEEDYRRYLEALETALEELQGEG